jgi:isopenicillin N synthase-like dioxygenase
MTELTTVETFAFLEAKNNGNINNPAIMELCKKAADSFKETGILIVRDPRVNNEDNNSFLNVVEDYFAQDYDTKMQDARPEYGYQVGVTPDHTEVPRCISDERCQKVIEKLTPENKPQPLKGPDAKWRFFWRMGKIPPTTKFPVLNIPPVIPKAFPNWSEVMNRWGTLMMEVCTTVAEMTAIGLGLEGEDFTRLVTYGPHLLAPTASDVNKYNQINTIFAGFHYDLNFFTIHGKSRYPGLYVWKRDGNKIPVRVPDGCLLVQAGKQAEWLTGGTITAGYHEVVVNEGTLTAAEKAKELGRPLWRISSTLFLHVASDETLQPLKHFANVETVKKYPPTLAGDYVTAELKTIKLMAD